MEYIVVALFVSLLWGIQPVLHKVLLSKYKPITILIISSFLYFYLIAIVAFVRNGDVKNDLKNMTKRDVLVILSIGLFSGFIGYKSTDTNCVEDI